MTSGNTVLSRAYLAGPMRGQPWHGFHTFDEATALLRKVGWEIDSPSEYTQSLGAVYSEDDVRLEGPVENDTLSQLAAWDFAHAAQADVVIALPGWESSEGASVEVSIARFCKKPVYGFVIGKSIDGFDLVELKPVGQLPPSIAAALNKISAVFTRKNADYRDETEPWDSNFRDTGRQLNMPASDATEMLIAVKQARLRALRANGRPPSNEAAADTVEDRAVYSVIALAQLMEATGC
jgi:hypothetical protein